MTFDEPVLNVLVYAVLAAAAAALGAGGPWLAHLRGVLYCVGLASAVAAGLMLGSAHLLVASSLKEAPLWLLAGAVGGLGYTAWASRFSSAEGFSALQEGLHGSAEGVAIGVAFVIEIRLGIFVALTLALHNVAESFVMTDQLRREGLRAPDATALSVGVNAGQPLLALAVWALHPLIEPLLPIAVGFAAAALTFLVLAELLPRAYRRATRVTIAAATSLAAAAVVLLESFFL